MLSPINSNICRLRLDFLVKKAQLTNTVWLKKNLILFYISDIFPVSPFDCLSGRFNIIHYTVNRQNSSGFVLQLHLTFKTYNTWSLVIVTHYVTCTKSIDKAALSGWQGSPIQLTRQPYPVVRTNYFLLRTFLLWVQPMKSPLTGRTAFAIPQSLGTVYLFLNTTLMIVEAKSLFSPLWFAHNLATRYRKNFVTK